MTERYLLRKEQLLLTLRDNIYGGSWENMIMDLTCRIGEGPDNDKLVERMQSDLQLIEELRQMERENRILKTSSKSGLAG
ncbi:MAG: hypothetical protein HY811_09400 [Planctomycetes bacterium]|nr:hypothetical protein [Planctomycetota bacterium]